MPVPGGVDSTLPWGNFKLEVAFASTPFAASPTWTDITAYWVMAQQTSINRGRGSELDTVTTSTLTLTLDNTDGRFTVGNASGAYYPNVKIRKQIRLTYTPSYSGASTFPIFKGYVDEWPVEWPDGGELYAWAQISASDRFKPLGNLRTLRSVPQEAILSDNPAGYWPLNEPAGATSGANISTSSTFTPLTITQAGTGGTVAFGTGTGVPTDGASAPIITQVDGVNGKYLTATGSIGFGFPQVAVGCEINTLDTDGVVFQLGQRFGDVSQSCIAVFIDSGVAKVFWRGDAFPTTQNLGVTLNDGHTHDVSCLVAGTSCAVYVDGVLATTATNGTLGLQKLNRLTVCGGPESITTNGDLLSATVCHVRVYAMTSVTLTGTDMADHANGALNGYAGESTGARVGRVADWCQIATADRAIDTGSTTSIRHVDTTGKTAQGYLQELADTEGGLVFMDAAGKLTFQGRSARYNQTAVVTLSTLQQQVGENVQYRSNDQLLLNDVTYTREGGTPYRAVDVTSRDTDYGPAIVSRESYTTSDIEVRAHAEFVVRTSKDPTPRIENLTVDLLTDPAFRVQALGLDLSDMVTVTGMPGAAPGASTSAFVEGYRETISLSEWIRELNTSPAPLYSPFWKLGVHGFSELGTTTRLAF